jgi:hypothetical protein
MTARWQPEAACRGVALDVFFNRHRRHEALAYCDRCPVVQACLDDAMAFEEDEPVRAGIYGGATANARKARARMRRRTAGAA